MLRRWTATMSRVGTGSCAGRATSSSPSGCAAEPRDQGDAEPGLHQGQVGVELHRLVGDPRQPAGAVVHPGQPLRGRSCLGGGDPVLVDQVARADPRPAGEPVAGVDDHVGDVAGQRTWSRGGRGWPAARRPSCARRRGRSGPEATRSTVSHGSRSVRDRVRSGCAVAQVAQGGRHQAAHRRRERRRPAGGRRRCRPGGAGRPRPARGRSSSRMPSSTRWRPWPVSITPRPTRSRSGTPVCRSSRLTCWETALGVKPSASAAATTEPWVSTARSEARAGRSIMKRCYME